MLGVKLIAAFKTAVFLIKVGYLFFTVKAKSDGPPVDYNLFGLHILYLD